MMDILYNRFWKLMIDKNMKKFDLINNIGISSTVAKMTKEKPVSLTILERICKELDCNFRELISYNGHNVDKTAE